MIYLGNLWTVLGKNAFANAIGAVPQQSHQRQAFTDVALKALCRSHLGRFYSHNT